MINIKKIDDLETYGDSFFLAEKLTEIGESQEPEYKYYLQEAAMNLRGMFELMRSWLMSEDHEINNAIPVSSEGKMEREEVEGMDNLIAEIDMSALARRACEYNNILTIRDLSKITKRQLLKTKRIGRVTVFELERLLWSYKLSLR